MSWYLTVGGHRIPHETGVLVAKEDIHAFVVRDRTCITITHNNSFHRIAKAIGECSSNSRINKRHRVFLSLFLDSLFLFQGSHDLLLLDNRVLLGYLLILMRSQRYSCKTAKDNGNHCQYNIYMCMFPFHIYLLLLCNSSSKVTKK